MQFNYQELNNCLEAIKTASNIKLNTNANIIILSNPTKNKVTFIGIDTNYQVIKTVQPKFFDNDKEAEIIINLKKLSDLTQLAKPITGTETSIDININLEKNELSFCISKFVTSKNQLLSRITQYIPYILVSSDKRHGGLDTLNLNWLFSLTANNSEDTISLNAENFISILNKMTAGDAPQIIISRQTKAIATCNSNYAVYKEDPDAELTVVLQTAIAKKIITVFKACKTDKLILHKVENENNKLIIFDENQTTIIQTEIPLAKKLLVNYINGFNSADYKYAGAIIQRTIFIDFIKCFETLTNNNRAILKFNKPESTTQNWSLTLEVPDSTSRQNDMVLQIENMLGDTNINNKTFKAALDTVLQMLNTCDTPKICLSLALPDLETDTATQVQPLLKIASLLEDNVTEGLKNYSILE